MQNKPHVFKVECLHPEPPSACSLIMARDTSGRTGTWGSPVTSLQHRGGNSEVSGLPQVTHSL